jgi:rare lipoprotein A
MIDLSYAAALKLGFAQLGSAEVELESIEPGQAVTPTQQAATTTAPAAATTAPAATTTAATIPPAEVTTPLAAAMTAPAATTTAATIAPDAAPTPPAATTTEQALSASARAAAVYVQVGAFSSRDNAESLRSRLEDAGWLKDTVQVLAIGNLWRLHVGPYRTQDDARSVAERIESQLSIKPLLVVR